MAGYKETPRQKMISMMYLVLTALLALNVAKQILDAFVVVNESMEATNENFSQKINQTYAKFKEQYALNPEKVGKYWEKAKKVQTLSKSINDYIDTLKVTVIAKTEKIPHSVADTIKLIDIKNKDNFDMPTHYFIGTDMKKGIAYDLKDSISAFRERILSFINEEDRPTFANKIGLVTEGDFRDADKQKQSWEEHNFYHTILAADVVLLNELKAEVYNAESDIVNYLLASISAKDFKVSDVEAKVIPESKYVFQGDDYTAEILVAAVDNTQNPEVYILDGADTLTVANIDRAKKYIGKAGVVKLELPANSLGEKKYAGLIKLMTPMGVPRYFGFKSDYIVAKPSATISPTKMNVFYRGVDNPVAISASGKSDAQLQPSITAGSLTRSSEGGWIVKNIPNNANKVTIKVYADDAGGKKFMGEQEFRVKRLPDPIAKVPGTKSGKIAKNQMLANAFLMCRLPEWVDFEYPFKVTSFTMIVPSGGGYVTPEKSKNQMFTDKMKRLIKGAKKGDIIIFKDIKVKGPEGPRKIESINVEIK
jgi:gliding motility-associated protein GldM